MLDHLYKRGGKLDYLDTNKIKKDHNALWDAT